MASVHVVRFFATLVSILMIVLNVWFLYYVEQIKAQGCSCALGWRRTFMQASLIAFVVFGIAGMFERLGKTFPILGLLLGLLSIAYIVVTRQFIHEIKRSHCQCAETKAFEVLDYLNAFQMFLLVVLAFLLVVSIVSAASTMVSKRR